MWLQKLFQLTEGTIFLTIRVFWGIETELAPKMDFPQMGADLRAQIYADWKYSLRLSAETHAIVDWK